MRTQSSKTVMRQRDEAVSTNQSSSNYKRLLMVAILTSRPCHLVDSSSDRPVSTAMHLFTVTSILVVAAGLCHAQADDSATNADNHWCGNWAGSPKPEDVPTAGQLPNLDYQRRQFIEPQLQRTPFSPVMASEEKVQIPKIWGNSTFHTAPIRSTPSNPPTPQTNSASRC